MSPGFPDAARPVDVELLEALGGARANQAVPTRRPTRPAGSVIRAIHAVAGDLSWLIASSSSLAATVTPPVGADRAATAVAHARVSGQGRP
jgi:hypothetical protein